MRMPIVTQERHQSLSHVTVCSSGPMSRVRVTLLACLLFVMEFSACSKANNILLGRVEAQVGPYTVVVTDCYRTEVPAPQKLESGPEGRCTYRFTPCRDADIRIEGSELMVNGTSYGDLKQGDTVVVDHGRVLVNDIEATVRSH
jgi:hypothetical protein